MAAASSTRTNIDTHRATGAHKHSEISNKYIQVNVEPHSFTHSQTLYKM